MKPLEPYDQLLQMAEMHDEMIVAIKESIAAGDYVEACWYEYGCLESRIGRMIEKVIAGCPKSPRKSTRAVGISTKVECLSRIAMKGHPFFDRNDQGSLGEMKKWIRKKNNLVHRLVTLDEYLNSQSEFESLARDGLRHVEKAYSIASRVRERFYSANSIPQLDDKKCRCGTRCIKIAVEE